MGKYFVADSYAHYKYNEDNAFEQNGKLYVEAHCKCGKCGGSGRVPYYVDNGICYDCDGSGVEYKTIRLYTEKEKNALDKAAARRVEVAEKKAQERFLKEEQDSEKNKQAWMEKNGFDSTGITYLVRGNSYNIKDLLKENGFRFDNVKKWYGNKLIPLPEGYEFVPVAFDDLYEWQPHLKNAYYKETAQSTVNTLLYPPKETDNVSEWCGEVGDKIEINAVVERVGTYNSVYGGGMIYTFNCDDNIFTWMTTKDVFVNNGDTVVVKGTVKKLDEYKGVKQTVLTRCKVAIV